MTIHTTFATGDTNVFRLPAAVNHAEVRVNGVPVPCSVSAGVVTMPFTPAPLAMLEFEYDDPGPVDWSFYAPLKTDLFLPRGVGPATFTRATTATVQDFQGMIRTAKAGEARFQGARRVQNLVTTSSVDLTTGWTASGAGTGSAPTITAITTTLPDGTSGTASRLQMSLNGGTTSADISHVRQTFPPTAACVCSMWIRSNSGSPATISLRASSGGPQTNLTITTEWKRYSWSGVGGSLNAIDIGLRGGQNPVNSDTADILVYGAQCEDTSGQSNQNPSEYVSVGVASAPLYHGAGVDGVKYFPYENGNTVGPGNVVNEARGPAIPDSKLRGYLAEGARTNLLLRSEEFDNASWAKNRASITANAAVSPDGLTTADKLVEDTTVDNSHTTAQVVTGTADAPYTVSCFFKAAERQWMRILAVNGANSFGSYFDVGTGALGSGTAAGAGTFINAVIEQYPNGWYRCSVTGTVGGGATAITIAFQMSIDNNDPIYTGDGTSGMYLWGAQFEDNVSFASSYIPTAGSTVTRHADVLTYPFAGNALEATGAAYAELGTLFSIAAPETATAVGFAAPGGLMRIGSQAVTVIAANDGTTTVSKTGLTSMATGSRKRAISWGTALSATGDGAEVATGAFDGSIGSTAISIGCDTNGNRNWYGTIRNVKVAKRAMREIQLRQLTS